MGEFPPIDELPLGLALARPSWADPKYMLATSAYRTRTINYAPGPVTLIAPANPTRWGMGFVGIDPAMPLCVIRPIQFPAGFAYLLAQGRFGLFLSAFQSGPMVQDQWVMEAVSTGVVMLMEVYTL